MYAQIEIVNHELRPKYVIMPTEFLVIGRSQNADVVLEGDSSLSRLHCKVFYHQKIFYIEDLESRNHTYLNEKEIKRERLKSGDIIRLGRHRICFTILDRETGVELPTQEDFFLLKREDKLVGKILVKLNLLSREKMKECIHKQEEMILDGVYYSLSDVLLQEKYVTEEQLEKVQKYKTTPPFLLNDYKFHEMIGMGGMGSIYRAHSIKKHELVAIKVFSNSLEEFKEQMEQQFRREAQVMLQLNHWNIVRGIHFGEINKEEQSIYIIMEYIDGPTLQQDLKDKGGRLLPNEALDITIQITQALNHAHEHNLIHRDIKPENILLTREGVVKLCDFGLVKDTTNSQEPKEEKVFGTVAYMSPEQIRSDHTIDIRSDIYSLGAVCYRMTFGKLPFVGESQAIRRQHLTQMVQFPHEGGHYQKMEMARVIRKMMSKKPEERYQSPNDLLFELERLKRRFENEDDNINATAEVLNLGDTSTSLTHKPMRVSSFLVKTVLLFLAGILCFVVGTIYYRNKQENLAYQRVLKRFESGMDNFEENCDEAKFFLKRYPNGRYKKNIQAKLESYIKKKSYEEDTKKYLKISEELEKNDSQGSIRKAKQFMKNCAHAPYVKMLRIQLETLAYHRAVKAFNQDNVGKAEKICKEIQENSSNSELRQKTQFLLTKIESHKVWMRERSFYQKLKESTELLNNGKIFEAGKKLLNLKKELKNFNLHSQKRLQRLWKHTYNSYLRAKKLSSQSRLEKFRYYNNIELEKKVERIDVQKCFASKIFLEPKGKRKPKRKNTGIFLTLAKDYIYALDVNSGRILWSKYFPGMAKNLYWLYIDRLGRMVDSFKADRIFLGFQGKKLVQMVSKTSGRCLWKIRLPENVSALPICVEDHLYISCADKYTYKVRASWGELEGAFRTHDVVFNTGWEKKISTLYLGGQGSLYGFYTKNNQLRSFIAYQGKLAGIVNRYPYILLLLVQQNSTILSLYRANLGLNSEQNTSLYSWKIRGKIFSKPQIFQEKLLFATKNQICILNLKFLSIAKVVNPNALELFPLKQEAKSLALLPDPSKLLIKNSQTSIYLLSQKKHLILKKTYKDTGQSYLPWQHLNDIYFISSSKKDYFATAWSFKYSENKIIWRKKLGQKFLPPPVIKRNRIWISLSDGSVYQLKNSNANTSVHLHLSGKFPKKLFSLPKSYKLLTLTDTCFKMLNLWTGKTIRGWKIQKKFQDRKLGLAHRVERYLFVTDRKNLELYSLKSGRMLSRFSSSKILKSFLKPVYYRRRIFVGNENGKLYCFRIVRYKYKKRKRWKFRLAWIFKGKGDISQLPVSTKRLVYFPCKQGNVYAIKTKQGKKSWIFEAKNSITSPLLLRKKYLYFGNQNGEVFCLSGKTGKLYWKYGVKGNVEAKPIYISGKVYFITKKGFLYCFDAKVGKLFWEKKLSTEVGNLFFHCQKNLYIGNKDGSLLKIRI